MQGRVLVARGRVAALLCLALLLLAQQVRAGPLARSGPDQGADVNREPAQRRTARMSPLWRIMNSKPFGAYCQNNYECSTGLCSAPRGLSIGNDSDSDSEAMHKRSRLNKTLDPSRYEVRVSTSNMFAHLEDCLESQRPNVPGPRNQIQNRPKHRSAGRSPEEEGDYAEGEWALVTRRSRKRESPAKPAKVDADAASCSRGDKPKPACRDPGREEEKDDEDDQTSKPCPEFNLDLDDDFPPLSRAGFPDGMAGKKLRHPTKKSLHPDAQSNRPERGDSVSLKGSGGDELGSALAGPQAAEDPTVFQFFSDEKLESTDEEPSISQDQLSEELSKLIQGKYSSQGILTWAPEKKPPRKTPQPEAQSSSPEGPASANLEGRTSSQLCAGDETVQPPAAEPQAAEEDEDEALGSSVEEDYITVEELQEELSRLLEGNHSSQEMISWLQATVHDDDMSSDDFLEVLMTCMCQSEVVVWKRDLSVMETVPDGAEVPYVDGRSMLRWTPLLKVLLPDQEKELTALKALGDVMMRMQHPDGLLEMILDVLIDEEVIQDSTFLRWKDSEEQRGNQELLCSVSRFFCWLQGCLS